ncbi:alpha carbonic anhydrase 4-like [Andrographis paniculata]|uniref:alpha carbonic anhydrase 4-like n=1 Tax=Andrographis paniculata TaxID=175694 RepID=UPI0021E7C0E9|nr:alpha carbonic anhydrase 4-like [Andrographis paniculata]
MGFKNNSLVLRSIKFFIVLIPSLFMVNVITSLEVEDEFSYDVNAPNGPQNWGNLNPDWILCGTGRSQSPINIISRQAVVQPSLGELNQHYRPAPAVLKNTGHDMEVEWSEYAGGVVIGGTFFLLVQCHWHISSEHAIDGERKPLELHIVHKSSEGYTAVVAFRYNLGERDHFLEQFIPYLQFATQEGVNVGVVNPSDIGFSHEEYYRYNGSLTTPPCSENVTWTVFTSEKTVSLEQIQALNDAAGNGEIGNARPNQPINGRTIYIYRLHAALSAI